MWLCGLLVKNTNCKPVDIAEITIKCRILYTILLRQFPFSYLCQLFLTTFHVNRHYIAKHVVAFSRLIIRNMCMCIPTV